MTEFLSRGNLSRKCAFLQLHFLNFAHLLLLQVTCKQLACHNFIGVGLTKWDHMTRPVNCSFGVECQLIVEPQIEPMGFTAGCSDTWATKLTPCWNECRKKVVISGIPFDEVCSFCCTTELCNLPSAFGFAVNSNRSALTAPELLLLVTGLIISLI